MFGSLALGHVGALGHSGQQRRQSAIEELRALLFANGEPGVMYDNTDPTTMWQDANRTTPVTATGQSVRFQDDLRLGRPTLGPELVTNGDFSSATGWTLGTGWTISGGKASYVNSGSFSTMTQALSLAAGAQMVTITVSDYVDGVLRVWLGNAASGSNWFDITANGSYSRILFFAAGDTQQIVCRSNGASGLFNGAVDNISVRALPGNHRTQPTSDANRALYTTTAAGQLGLRYDGTDDWLQTGTITPGTDKVQVFGVWRKLGSTAQVAVESGTGGNNGSFFLQAPASGSVGYLFDSRGTLPAVPSIAGFAAPITNVVTALGDISGDLATLRVNGAQVAQSTANQGTGNYLAYPLFFGRRGGSSLPFNGHELGLTIVRFGPNLTLAQIQRVEALLNQIAGGVF